MRLDFYILTILIICASCKVSQRITDDNQLETVDIRNLPQEMFDPYYNDFEIQNYRFVGKDSTILTHLPNGEILTKGKFARNSEGEVTRLRIGEFMSYYENGNLKEQGNYEIGRYTQCCAGGICSQFYNFKLGTWNYYYENGNSKARVFYEDQNFHIDTSCEGGDKMKFGKIDLSKSEFGDINGKEIQPSKELIKELQTVNFSIGGYLNQSFTINGKNIE